MKQTNSLFNRSGLVGIGLFALATIFGITSCRPDYDLDKRFPEWLGTSIFETLSEGFKGDSTSGYKNYEFTTFVKLIQDVPGDYENVLSKTGSKTLFVADDDAFARFFGPNCPFKKSNGEPVQNYSELSLAQKRLILNGCMLNNVYQVAMLSSTEGPKLGDCMRRVSASDIYDSIPVLKPDKMPNTPYWSYLKDRAAGIPIMQDGTKKPMIFFVNKFLTSHRITDDDYKFLFNMDSTKTKRANDASVNGVRIEYQNKKCFNGFIHVMEDVIYLLPNMAEYLAENENSKVYTAILDRFSAPFYPEGRDGVTSGKDHTAKVKGLIEDGLVSNEVKAAMAASNDSVYTKMYFSKRSKGNNKVNKTPADKTFGQDAELLKFDPGWNTFFSSETGTPNIAVQQDMGVMMVPTDEAMLEWWVNKGGKALRLRYGVRATPPTNTEELIEDMSAIDLKVIVKLVNNNMFSSLTATVPSKFANVLNDANDPMFDDPDKAISQIEKVVMCCNGAIYFTNEVWNPTAYRSVSYPALVNEKLQVIDWAIEDDVLSFSAYLNSMVTTYSFFVPEVSYADTLAEDLKGKLIWVDPTSFAIKKYKSLSEDGVYLKAFVFSYDNNKKAVMADVYNYDDTTNTILNKTTTPTIDGTTTDGLNIIRDRLEDLMDYHIIIGDVEDASVTPDANGYAYFRTKGRGTIRFKNADNTDDMEVAGGWQLETGEKVKILERFDMGENGNGKTYVLDRPLQTSRMSVYDILSDADKYPEFSKFFDLMNKTSVFSNESNKNDIGARFCVNLFNTYHYTIYVPCNDSLQSLFDKGILFSTDELTAIDTYWQGVRETIYDDLYLDDVAQADIVWRDSMINLSRKVRGAEAGDPNIKADSTFNFKTNYTDVKRELLRNFVKYHIQDNSVYTNAKFEAGKNLDGTDATEANYETAYMRTSDRQFVKVKVRGGDDVEITDAVGNVRHVLKQYSTGTGNAPLWNIMCREYEYKQNGNSTLITDASKATIETSSYVVIHLIDGALCSGDVKF